MPVLLTVMAFALIGCSTPATETTVATTSSPTTTAATTTTQATTTTLDEEGVLSAFIANFIDPRFQAWMDVTVEFTVGDVTVDGSGIMEVDGENSHTVLEIVDFQRSESITHEGETYERVNDGPWVRIGDADASTAPGETAQDLAVVALMRAIVDLEHVSTTVEDGVTLHSYEVPEGSSIDPVAFGFASDAPVTVEATFWARGDGSPHEFVFAIDDQSDSEFPLQMTMSLLFVEKDDPIEIEAPSDPWRHYLSPDNGYSIGYPSGWEIEEIRDEFILDNFYGLGGEVLSIFWNEVDPPGAVSLNSWVDSFRTAGEDQGGSFEEASETLVGGLPARTITFRGEDQIGPFVAIYVVVQVSEPVVVEFILYGDPSEKAATQALMDDLLGTFGYLS